MTETLTAPPPAIQPDAVFNLVTGKTLQDLIEIKDTVTTDLGEARSVAEALTKGSGDEVVTALRKILASQTSETDYPALPAFVAQAQPHHKHMPLVVAALKADVPIWLYGEAGSGKSTTGRLAAQALKLAFRSISLGPTTSKSDLLGYRDAVGQYQSTGFREVYEGGGVFLFDEIDNAHPSILTLLNSSIANGHGEFPDAEVPRSETTRFIATANTIGRGATAQYVGRAPIDAATIDRFAFIPMDIDEQLEDSLILGTPPDDAQMIHIGEGEVPDPKEWLALVRANRQAADELGIRTIISPRAAIYGARLAAQGVGKTWLHEMLIYKGMKEQDRKKLQSTATRISRIIFKNMGIGEPQEAKESSVAEFSELGSLEIPRFPMRLSGKSFAEYVRSSLDSADIEQQKFIAALSWHLEKHTGRTLYGDLNALNQVDNELDNNPKTINEFIASIDRVGWAKSILMRDLNRPEDYLFNLFTITYHKFSEKLDEEYLTLPDKAISSLQKEFKNTYGFSPGPYSLAWWNKHIRRAED